ncbi:MAG: 16S rRNA (uracil(1498)-N(3))-methyltransferase [Deltaproteobacteria bacterium]|nr:16S rRNA (uracil(1498)-N(3))-methyltransferase [Deltaproteobacteria bacterium]MCL4874823.1 16S rRNA (uracil(1498)-N(3))-methyltransferase [bacterium]
MRRFYKEDLSERSTRVDIAGEEFYHLKKVLRLAQGVQVFLFNGKGLELSGKIEEVGKGSASVIIEGSSRGERESPLGFVLLQALLKGDRPEFIIQKATELGIREVCFYNTSRTIPRVSADKEASRQARWKKTAVEAAKQCGRTVLPEINFAPDLKGALKGHDDNLKLLLWEKEGAAGLKDALKGARGKSGISVLVGPEGGLSPGEAAEATGAGFVKAGLGPRILRAETAALAIMSIVQHALGDLG